MNKIILAIILLTISLNSIAQEEQWKSNISEFKIIKQNPITSVKDQYRSGTCWCYATLGYFESEILRKTGLTYDLCEMFVVNHDYMDCAEHYVRMHGFSQISEGGSADDVLEVLRTHGICPEEAMPAPGSLVGSELANFEEFFPELDSTLRSLVNHKKKSLQKSWRDTMQNLINRNVGKCPQNFEYQGKKYTPQTFAQSLNLDWNDYVSITSFTNYPMEDWCIIEAPYKWRTKQSYNVPIEKLMEALDKAIMSGYTVAWGGDVTGDFIYFGHYAKLRTPLKPKQDIQKTRQKQFDDWTMTYDHVMVIFGIAQDQDGNKYYLTKNSWGNKTGDSGVWYMSSEFVSINTVYLFLNQNALKKDFFQKSKQ